MKVNTQLLVGLRSQSSSSCMIQFFVIVAVALGIASVLVVSVVQKSREIGILKAMGTPTRRIVRVFLIQGALVGLAGLAARRRRSARGSPSSSPRSRPTPTAPPTFPVDSQPRALRRARR